MKYTNNTRKTFFVLKHEGFYMLIAKDGNGRPKSQTYATYPYGVETILLNIGYSKVQ